MHYQRQTSAQLSLALNNMEEYLSSESLRKEVEDLIPVSVTKKSYEYEERIIYF